MAELARVGARSMAADISRGFLMVWHVNILFFFVWAFLSCVACPWGTVWAQQVTVDWTVTYQEVDGFGASSAFLPDNGINITDDQADLFFSQDKGMGLSLHRTRVSPDGDYQESTVMKKSILRGARVWSTPWSPPAYMKSNGSTSNGGSLLPLYYQDYAGFLSNYVRTLKTQYGISLYGLSIQNEPDMVADYESCTWTGSQFRDFLTNNLTPTFASDGVSVKVIMPEESTWSFDLAEATLKDSSAAAGVNTVAAHNYSGSEASPYPLAKNLGKRLWETEVSDFNSFDAGMENGLLWAQEIHDWMTIAQANAWHYWWLISPSTTTCDVDGDNEGLTCMGKDGVLKLTKRLYTVGNFSKFVRPGYRRMGATASPTSGVSVSGYREYNSGKFAIVAINRNALNMPLNFKLKGFYADSVTRWVTSSTLDLAEQSKITIVDQSFSTELPAKSVTTFTGVGHGNTPLFRLSVAGKKARAGDGTIMSDDGVISCPTGCTAEYYEGSLVTITAAAAAGSTFAGWVGKPCSYASGNLLCLLTMDKSYSVGATFVGPSRLKVAKIHKDSGDGKVTSDQGGIKGGINCGAACDAYYPLNTTVTLTATADTGSTFTQWRSCPSPLGDKCSVTMDKARTVSATFVGPSRLKVAKIHKDSGDGKVTSDQGGIKGGINCGAACDDYYPLNTTVTLTATADTGSTFTQWRSCPSPLGDKCSVTMDKAHSIGVVFSGGQN